MLVVAHRTCPEHAPENSIEGVRTAARLGAHAVEVDVRLSRDGVPVLFHDQHLLRIARRPIWVHRSSATTLAGHGIPSLAEAAAALPAGLELVLDLKADEAAMPAVQVIDDAGVLGRTRFWTREPTVATMLRERLGAQVEVALLRDTRTESEHARLIDDALACGANAVSVAWAAVDPSLATRVRDRGLRLYSWCRTRGAHVDKTNLLDALITDWPEDVIAR